ncbi:protein ACCUMULATION AND REPLICATION OF CHLOROPLASTS 3, chloroplastic isoform X1 [Solanum dulcamara]|uniref:protein ACCUMULATION AND REPLICATION OF CHLOROPLASTS 3, chloroplastic isoform X1 n=1 Tax=Solanum dulcamara TaxID=45834 RepID=UPI002486B0F2|nr:protein ACCUMULATION AND REPLICATION OF CHLOROPLASTS 3, chloroplastic isoform X1 [Solanum dulcamara]
MDLLLPIPARLSTFSRASVCTISPINPFNSNSFTYRRVRTRVNCSPKPVGVETNSNFNSRDSNNCELNLEDDDIEEADGLKNVWEETEFVEVFGIGSRKDALLEFCLASPSLSPALRFWNILVKDSEKVLLQEKVPTEDVSSRTVEVPSAINSCSKAVILVASAAYGSDHVPALDIIRKLKSRNGLAIGIILKPFSFEGRRRYDEVTDLIDKLQKHATVCIVIDTDGLLKKDLLTLDEALKTSYNAVLMAVNAISILMSEDHIKLLDATDCGTKELSGPELIKILESYKEAKTGFGAGYNVETSILRAVYDCPFFGLGVKGSNGVVICIIASSGVVSSSDVRSILRTFRQITGCNGDIVISIVQEASMEPNIIVTTVVTCGYAAQESSGKTSLLSRLAQHIPFIFKILKKPDPPLQTAQESEIDESPETSDMAEFVSMDNAPEDMSVYSGELQALFRTNGEETSFLRDYSNVSDERKIELSNSAVATEAPFVFKRELLTRWNLGPGKDISEGLATEGTENLEAKNMVDNTSTYKLPVGIKHKEQLQTSSSNSRNSGRKSEESKGAQPRDISNLSQDAVDEEYSEIVADVYNSNLSLIERNYASVPKRKGVLSTRAASMLEAERDSKKKWIPVVEMKYRGGIYRGRIEGGLPEGKGCLSLEDGSKYDGMWRYGKKSGLGTFYFNNGDTYRGSWRDDLMHGKGWFYFHTGDRWFVSFWKGKANGEGRFYSKLGDVFFGHFKDGLRHGHFLCINIDGTRSIEVWDEGLLQSRKNLDSDTETG